MAKVARLSGGRNTGRGGGGGGGTLGRGAQSPSFHLLGYHGNLLLSPYAPGVSKSVMVHGKGP